MYLTKTKSKLKHGIFNSVIERPYTSIYCCSVILTTERVAMTACKQEVASKQPWQQKMDKTILQHKNTHHDLIPVRV